MKKVVYKGKRIDNDKWIYFNEYGAYCDKDGNVLCPKRFTRDFGYGVISESVSKVLSTLTR